MKINFKVLAVASVVGAMFVIDAQDRVSNRQERADGTMAENSLVGVDLFETGLSLLDKFGSPADIVGLTIGGGSVGPTGGFGSPLGGAGPTPGGGGSRGNPLGMGILGNPFGPADPLNLIGQGGGQLAAADEGALPGQGGDSDRGSGLAESAAERVLYTRWIYHQPTSRYGFVVDKNQRVIQIEAVGLSDRKVKTDRGITFGSSFEDVVRAYGVPDAYEISGTTLVLRFLVRDHVAFRLSKLDVKKPHQVTGVVVAAGKH